MGVGGGVTGYSPVPRFETPEATPAARNSSPAPSSSLRSPAFKGAGMKLGSKKTKQAELLDALGGDILAAEEVSAPTSPVLAQEPVVRKDPRGSLPTVDPERSEPRSLIR
jgi:hypothetical protein